MTHDLLMSGINEESLRRLPSLESFPQLHLAAKHLRAQFSALQVDYELLEKATQSMSSRTEEDVRVYNGMVSASLVVHTDATYSKPFTRSRESSRSQGKPRHMYVRLV